MAETTKEILKDIEVVLDEIEKCSSEIEPTTKQEFKVISFYKYYAEEENEILTEKVVVVGDEQVLKVVEENGFFNQCTEEDVEKFKKGEICGLSWDNELPEYDEPSGYSVWVTDFDTLGKETLVTCLGNLEDIKELLLEKKGKI